MMRKIELILIASLTILLLVVPAHAEVEDVIVSPSISVAGEAITFYGMTSTSDLGDRLAVNIYSGPNCQASRLPSPPIASTYTLVSNTPYTITNNTVGEFNVTLTFPVSASSGWTVEQEYRNGFPEGSYSVGVQDITSASALCMNFAVTNTPIPEFSAITDVLLLALGVVGTLYLEARAAKFPT